MADIIDITGDDSQQACADAIIAVFPDICPDYLDSVTKEKHFDSEVAISHILDQLESGKSYPRRAKASLKRKREPVESEVDEAEQLSKRFSSEDHRQKCESAAALPAYCSTSRAALAECFTRVPCKQLYRLFDEHGRNLFATYLAINDLLANWDDGNQPFHLNKRPRDSDLFSDESINRVVPISIPGQRQAFEELLAARVVARARHSQGDAERQRLREEEANLELARTEGTVTDCGCCYSECAKNRMVHCNGDDPHYFCKECARRMAETQIGLSKHSLACMSTDGCAAGFSVSQKQLFLDDKLHVALERIEQEEALRLAGIENLETCPFCPFAAEYPDVEIDKEFRCQNPECEITSCRLCRRETHIPKTCQEAALENGHSARRAIEEAMSAALIRKCNKCGTPFIKENGCNKMTCTRAGCHNVQCYICHKSCSYDHFNDVSRGGKSGNCPLFESVEKRHNDEVLAAEAKARQEVAQANPEVDAELLEIMVSDKVKEDEKKRRAASDAVNPERGLNALPDHDWLLRGPARRMPELFDHVNPRARAPPALLAPAMPLPGWRGPPRRVANDQAPRNLPPAAAAPAAAPAAAVPPVPPALPFGPRGDFMRQMQAMVHKRLEQANRQLAQANRQLTALRAGRGAPGAAVPMQAVGGAHRAHRDAEFAQACELARRARLGRQAAPGNPVQANPLAEVDMAHRGSRERPIQLDPLSPRARRPVQQGAAAIHAPALPRAPVPQPIVAAPLPKDLPGIPIHGARHHHHHRQQNQAQNHHNPAHDLRNSERAQGANPLRLQRRRH